MNGAKAPSLSIRQARAMALVTQGWSFEEIGRHLQIAPRVVLLYVIHLQRFLATRTRGDLTTVLRDARLLPLEWARAQSRRRRPRKPIPAPPPALTAGPPLGKARRSGGA